MGEVVRGEFYPQEQYLETLTVLVTLTVRSCYWYLVGEARGAATHPTVRGGSRGCRQTSHSAWGKPGVPPDIPQGTGELTTTKNYPAQEGNSAEVGKPLFSNVRPTATGTLWMLFATTVLGNGAWSGKCSIHIPSRCEYSFNLSYSPSLPLLYYTF